MNIFNKYGIKEVADITFYSIIRVGDEEFYIPVLFFDTLKVSTFNKNVEIVNEKGGKGNKKLLSWNFEEDSKLKLEDALFSQMSMDIFMNGRVMSKMSNWTSAVAKLNVANRYGQKNYSIKAFPSPRLTKEEEDIIFRCAQKVGYDPYQNAEDYDKEIKVNETKYLYDTENMNGKEDEYVSENRKQLLENYYKRTCPIPYSHDLSPYIDFNINKYEGVQVLLEKSDNELEEAKSFLRMNVGEELTFYRNVKIIFREKNEPFLMQEYKIGTIEHPGLQIKIKKEVDNILCLSAAILIDNNVIPNDFFPVIGGGGAESEYYEIGDNFFLTHIPFFIFPRYLEVAIGNLCCCDQVDKKQLAMPQKVVDSIISEIDSFKKIGRFENDLYETEYIDRFEKCIVNKKSGQKIDLYEQYINLKKMYNNEVDNYVVFYDEKTMLPFTLDKAFFNKLYNQKCLKINDRRKINNENILSDIKQYFSLFAEEAWIEELTPKDYIITNIIEQSDQSYSVFYYITKHDYITLKYGTIYYKQSRTINTDISGDTFIGTEISIDQETFPGEYLIVGETYIRDQRTGKDQRYQLLINRAAISSSTKIQLTADGDPTTFSMDIDLLAPLTNKKSTIELKQYNVEEDKQNGGTCIVSQVKKHSYTQILQTYNEIVIDNNEIY